MLTETINPAVDQLPPYVLTSNQECVAIETFPVAQAADPEFRALAARFAQGDFTHCFHILQKQVRHGSRKTLGAVVRVHARFHIVGIFGKAEDCGEFATIEGAIDYLQGQVNTAQRKQVRQLIAA